MLELLRNLILLIVFYFINLLLKYTNLYKMFIKWSGEFYL